MLDMWDGYREDGLRWQCVLDMLGDYREGGGV